MDTTQTVRTDSQIGQQLIEALHTGGVAAYYWTLHDKRSYWHPVNKNGVVPATQDVYFPVHPTRATKRNDQRATKKDKDVCVINAMFGEVDAKEWRYLNPAEQVEHDRIEAEHEAALGAYKLNYTAWVEAGRVGDEPVKPQKEKLVFEMEPAKAKALEHVHSMPLAPSIIIDSGGGYHLYWLLEHTFVIATDADRTRITRLQARWVDVMGGDTGAKDLERVLRVPGTTNGKYNPPRLVTVIDAPFTRYPLSQIEALAPALPNEDATPVAKARARAEAAQVLGGWTVAQIGRIAKKFGEHNSIVDILKQNAYSVIGNKVWRPGKSTDEGESGNIKDGCYFSFSSSDMDLGAMEAGDPAYSAFAAWAMFEHGGDQQVAASAVNISLKLGMKPRTKSKPPEPENADKLVGEGNALPVQRVDNGLPNIQINNREPRDVRRDCIEALVRTNEVFVRGGAPVRVLIDEKGRVSVENITVDTLSTMLTTVANFYAVRTSEKGKVTESISSVPVRIVRDILGLGHWPFPALVGIVESPIMRRNGSILYEPGYDKETKLFYRPAQGFDMPPVKLNPERADVDAAIELLRNAIVDFPFDSDASRDNALAATITPVVREVIEGSTPIPIIGASQQGAGKTKLAQGIGQIATGEIPEASPAPDSKEEWRKTVTAQLSTGRPVILLDNIMGTLEDGALAAVVTSATWSDRQLGHNDKIISLPAKAVWMVTGNNVRVGGDLGTRCYLINLDPKTSRPQDRDGFEHPHIETWIRNNRGLLLCAILTLCRAWHVAGRPKPDCPKSRYNEWRNVVGGILHHAGVKNFLGNQQQFQDAADTEGPAWEAFICKLAEVFPGQGVTPGMIYARFAASDPLADYLPEELPGLGAIDDPKAKNTFSQALAKAFRDKKGKRFGDSQARIVADRKAQGSQYWRFLTGPEGKRE